MSAAGLSHFDELVSHYLDDTLTDTAATELVALLAEPAFAARFLEMTRLNSEIAGLLAAPVPDAAMVELIKSDIEKSLAGAETAGGVRLRVTERAQPHTSAPRVVSALRPMPRPGKVARRPLAWAAVFCLFAGLAAFFLVNQKRLAEAPAVTSVEGDVRLVGLSGESVLTPGQSWPRAGTLKTLGANSGVTLKFRDGSRLDFGANTVAINESRKDGCRVGLEHGSLQAALKKQPEARPFVFVTPEAEAIVVGTKLRLFAGGHHTRLEVTEGTVRFRRRHDGVEVAVKAGHYAVVAPNVPFVATPFHPDPHAVH